MGNNISTPPVAHSVHPAAVKVRRTLCMRMPCSVLPFLGCDANGDVWPRAARATYVTCRRCMFAWLPIHLHVCVENLQPWSRGCHQPRRGLLAGPASGPINHRDHHVVLLTTPELQRACTHTITHAHLRVNAAVGVRPELCQQRIGPGRCPDGLR